MIALGIVFVPTLSLAGACKIYLLVIISFLHAIGVKVTNEKFSKLVPSASATSRCIKKTSAKTLAMIRRNVSDKKLHFACDAANKGGFHYVVKKSSWHDVQTSELNVIVADSDVCEGIDRETAVGVDFSFQKLDPSTNNKKTT